MEQTPESRELELYIVNDYDIYFQSIIPTIIRHKRMLKNGKYNEEKALSSWLMIAKNGAQKYSKIFGSEYYQFKKSDIELCAKSLLEYYEDEIKDAE
jgi:hypothetical protein